MSLPDLEFGQRNQRLAGAFGLAGKSRRMSGSQNDWFKWVVGVAISLVAAGGSIVAVLNYVNSPRPSDRDRSTSSPAKSESPKESPNNIENPVDSHLEKPTATRIAELRMDVRTEENMCKLVEFVQFQNRHDVYLKVDFIKKDSGGITDPGELGTEPASIKITANCEKVTPDALFFILGVGKGSYLWGRDDAGDGWVLEGEFYSQGVTSVGQGYFSLNLIPKH